MKAQHFSVVHIYLKCIQELFSSFVWHAYGVSYIVFKVNHPKRKLWLAKKSNNKLFVKLLSIESIDQRTKTIYFFWPNSKVNCIIGDAWKTYCTHKLPSQQVLFLWWPFNYSLSLPPPSLYLFSVLLLHTGEKNASFALGSFVKYVFLVYQK